MTKDPYYKGTMPIIRIATILAIAIMITWIFIIGRSILQPFVVAMFLFFFVTSLANIFARIRIFKYHLSWGLPTFLSLIVIFGATAVILTILVSVSAGELASKWNAYVQEVIKMVNNIDNWLGATVQGFTGQEFDFGAGPLILALQKVDINHLVSRLQQALQNAASFIGLAIVFLIFLLLEQRVFHKKLEALFPDSEKLSNVEDILLSIREGVFSYLQVKTFISALTGISTYVILRLFGVDFAEFWAVLTFILNYIPSIGSLAAVVFTCIFALVQEDFDGVKVGMLLVILTSVQQFLGGYLDPKISGERLNLSPVFIIFALMFWGKIWGIMGAFFCVPLTAILNIILANFEQTRPIAVLLSSRGFAFNGQKRRKEQKSVDKESGS